MERSRRVTDVRVQLVGPVAVWRGGKRYAAGGLGSRKARTLVALLGVESGRWVGMDSIVETLWPGRPPHNPPANVATMVSRLRSSFGVGLVIGGRAGYRLAHDVTTDLDEAARLLTTAGHARRALDLIDGSTVLADHPDAPWADAARAAHRELLRRGRHLAAAAALRTGDHATAAAAARKALSADPFDEAACRLLMVAHCALDEPGRALRAYEGLRATLAAELGCDPARATRELHVAILREDPAAVTAWPRGGALAA